MDLSTDGSTVLSGGLFCLNITSLTSVSPPLPQDLSALEYAIEEPGASSHPASLPTVDPPDMAASPELDSRSLLQLQEVDSSKPSERPSSPRQLPAAYSPPLGMDSHTVCIPSPYADSSHEYNHGHGPLNFYSQSVLSYARQPVTDSPSYLCPSISPSAFWPSHNHPSMPSLTLQCPQPHVYNEPSPHAPWLEPKAHAVTTSR